MASIYRDKVLEGHLNEINDLYDELDKLLLTVRGSWQTVNGKIQRKLREIEKARLEYITYLDKLTIGNKGGKKNTHGDITNNGIINPGIRYPSILDTRFNAKLSQHPLIQQYLGVYDIADLAAKLYMEYGVKNLNDTKDDAKNPTNKAEKGKATKKNIQNVADINDDGDKGNKVDSNTDNDSDDHNRSDNNIVLDVASGVDLFRLTPAQKMLRNFMAPGSPYRSILIDHGTGVGKTCTAITIAENLKKATSSSGRIYVIRPDEFQRQLFELGKVKQDRSNMQCTGDTYLDELIEKNPNARAIIEDCKRGRVDDCSKMERLVKTQIARYYDFATKYTWAQRVNKIINTRTTGLSGPDRHKKMVETIRSLFNNSVLIIDEAHNMRNSDSTDTTDVVADKDVKKAASSSSMGTNSKIMGNKVGRNKDDIVEDSRGGNFIINILRKVLLYSQNMRLILLSATPMYNKSQDIIPLINYMLLNDKRPEVRTSAIFHDGKLVNAKKILEVTRGYISYVRGNDPTNFPLRLTADVNLPASDLMDPKKYPQFDILGNKLLKNYHHCQYIPLIKCPMTADHQKALLKMIGYQPPKTKDVKKHHSKLTPIVLPDSDDMIQDDILEDDIIDVWSSIQQNTSSSSSVSHYSDDYADIDEIHKSVKSGKVDNKDISSISTSDRGYSVAYMSEIQMSNFLYQTLEESGGNPLACYGVPGKNAILEQVGSNSYKFIDDKMGHRFMMPELDKYGPKISKCLEQILKCDGPVFIYTYFAFSGVLPMAIALEMAGFKRYGNEKPLISSGATYRKKTPGTKDGRDQYIIYTGDKQLSRGAKSFFDKREAMTKDKNVKVVIASRKGSEGLNLFGFREMHIMDPWHNINLLEQTVGRVIRNKSHHHLPPEKRNVVVYNYATVLTGNMKNRESIDQRVYSIAEEKALEAGKVEKLLKENAVDCVINRPLNQRPLSIYKHPVSIITGQGVKLEHSLSDKPFSKDTHYMDGKAEYKCIGFDDSNNSKTEESNNKTTVLTEPIDINRYAIEVREIMAIIINKLSTELTLLERDAIQITKMILDETLSGGTPIDTLAQIYAYIRSELDTSNMMILDKYDRECRLIALNGGKHGAIFRLIPTANFNLKQGQVEQHRPKFVSKSRKIGSAKPGKLTGSSTIGAYEIIDKIDINPLVQRLRKDKIKLKDKEKLQYNLILTNMENIIHGIIYQIESENSSSSSSSSSKSNIISKTSVSSSDIASRSNIYTNFMTIYNTNVPLMPKRGYNETYKLVFDRLIMVEKLHLLKNLVYRIKRRERLDRLERRILKVAAYNFVSTDEILENGESGLVIDYIKEPNRLYGFCVAGFNTIYLYKFNDRQVAKVDGEAMQEKTLDKDIELDEDIIKKRNMLDMFSIDKTNARKMVNKRWALLQKIEISDLFGFMIYTHNTSFPPIFKIMDYMARGRKKVVKGIHCTNSQTPVIMNYIKKIEPKYRDIGYKFSNTKRIICSDLEMFLRIADTTGKDSMRHFLSAEEYQIYREKSELG